MPLAFKLFSNWEALLAPAITQLISSLCKIHAIAKIDILIPSSSAILESFSTLSRFSSVKRLLICLSA